MFIEGWINGPIHKKKEMGKKHYLMQIKLQMLSKLHF
jgi:hypothetical protein